MRLLTYALATAAMVLPTLAVTTPAEAHRSRYRHSHRQTAYSEYRGNDGRTYCRRSNGTTGLVVGGVAGVLAGRAIDTSGDRTLGTLGGAAAGALLGREVDRSVSNPRRCR